ncbi:putative udp-glucuronate:xylan alpha-glucuronosyltransferase 4 [Fagus crenata]
MGSKTSSSKPKHFILFVLLLSFSLFILVLSFRPKLNPTNTRRLQRQAKIPIEFNLIAKGIKGKKVKVGLVNVDDRIEATYGLLELSGIEATYGLLRLSGLETEIVKVGFDHVAKDLTWDDFFPEWINEEYEKWGIPPKCPEIPLPRVEDYEGLDMVIARVPCDRVKENEGIRDLFRLQVNLVVANLVVRSGWISPNVDRTVYVVFIGSCGPMVEIFRCDDLVMHHGDYWVYKPELRRLKQKVLVPFGSCQLAHSFAKTGKF